MVGQQNPRLISGIQSGQRTILSVMNQKQINHENTTPNKIAQSEIDNHANTTCFGSNFTAISFMGEYCEVSPFSDQYTTLTNIPIASAAAAWDNPDTGEVVILLFNQGLWFGDSLTNSLINPNQCRMHGLEICNDTFDPHCELGITDPVTELFVPTELGNSFVYLTTRAPTIEELWTIEPLEMTSQAPWDPSKVGKHQLLWEEEERKALIGNVKIDQHTISRERPEEPQLKMDQSEFDILLSSCSAVYSKKTLIQRLVASVRVTLCYSGQEEANSVDKINRKVSAINTRARHKALSVEEVSRKFGIGLETERKMLKATLPYRIRHAVHLLLRQYRTDIMQSKRQ
jgi:hypothetical protein